MPIQVDVFVVNVNARLVDRHQRQESHGECIGSRLGPVGPPSAGDDGDSGAVLAAPGSDSSKKSQRRRTFNFERKGARTLAFRYLRPANCRIASTTSCLLACTPTPARAATASHPSSERTTARIIPGSASTKCPHTF